MHLQTFQCQDNSRQRTKSTFKKHWTLAAPQKIHFSLRTTCCANPRSFKGTIEFALIWHDVLIDLNLWKISLSRCIFRDCIALAFSDCSITHTTHLLWGCHIGRTQQVFPSCIFFSQCRDLRFSTVWGQRDPTLCLFNPTSIVPLRPKKSDFNCFEPIREWQTGEWMAYVTSPWQNSKTKAGWFPNI